MVSEEENESQQIRVSKATKDSLDSLKEHHRETYEDVILRLIVCKQGGAV